MQFSLAISIAALSASAYASSGIGQVVITPGSAGACGSISVPNINGYTYFGCMTDSSATSNTRSFNLASLVDNAMTPKMCSTFCASKGLPIFGVEYGTECWCGTYPRATSTPVADETCAMACGGDSSITCGGRTLLDTYRWANYTEPTIPTIANYVYKGCYTEPSSVRALASASLVDYTAMTVEKCAAFCSGKKYTMFGLEYAGECWCANSLSAGSVIAPNGDAECSSTCPGNYTQLACGDASRLNVYALVGSAGAARRHLNVHAKRESF